MRKIRILLFLLTLLCITPAGGQEKSANRERLLAELGKVKTALFPYNLNNQCESYGKPEFTGEKISFRFVGGSPKDVLALISDQYGCRFIVDESVAARIITDVRADDVPWNIALCSMLKDQGLIAQSEGSAIRIREAKSPEEITCKQDEKSGLSKTPLYTEFYRANYLKLWCPMPDNFSPEAKEPEERRNIRKFIDTLKNGLSSYGSIELDERTNTIAITDKEERVKLLVELIGLLDEPGLTVEEIVNDPDLRIK